MEIKQPSNVAVDLEREGGEEFYLDNRSVQSIAWRNVNVKKSRPPRNGKDGQRAILTAINGIAISGELMAIMGPSGCGKTTLLNVLACRKMPESLEIGGTVTVNGTQVSSSIFRSLTSYVEQEDALIGSLTVRETLDFAARLSLPGTVSKRERLRRVDELLSAFGLQEQAHVIVGTPIRRGISGGQKRRLGIASQLITGPKVLFLDEPTSGLDSKASFEVVRYLKNVTRTHKLLVVASIHQPSTSTFELFDKLLLLSSGLTCYFGSVGSIKNYMVARGSPLPLYINPAEFLLDLTSTDFSQHDESAKNDTQKFIKDWQTSASAEALRAAIASLPALKEGEIALPESTGRTSFFNLVLTLLHRSFIKSYRDIVAYGIRSVMYIGLAVMMGTVWLRLPETQSSIGPFTNAIFFGSAFMSFMAVAYVPAFLEDRATFIKERANGLYGATAFMLSNFLIGLPYLFLISLLFSVITYWLINFRPTATAFCTWVLWLFLDLLAGESLVVLMSSLFPNFVIALALTAFANGLWMSVGGFLVSPEILNPFWRYLFHYIDYQAYVFQGMMVNEFAYRTYSCSRECHCIYQTALAPQCLIDGKGVLEQYGYREGNTGKWVGISLAILLVYRLLGWLVTHWRET